MDLRCFISIELPEALKEEIGARTEALRAADAHVDVKWVRPENLHLTLKFLGNTPENTLPEIKALLEKAVGPHRRSKIRLSGVGVFPNRRHPRVIWIGLLDSESLKRLQQDIDLSLAVLGFEPEDREFSAHLTLGRLRSERGADAVIKALDSIEDSFGEIEVAAVSLMKSELKPAGPKYSKLFDIPLGV